jgi:hypothetical protein
MQLVDRRQVVEGQRVDAAAGIGKDGEKPLPEIAAAVMRRDGVLDADAVRRR